MSTSLALGGRRERGVRDGARSEQMRRRMGSSVTRATCIAFMVTYASSHEPAARASGDGVDEG